MVFIFWCVVGLIAWLAFGFCWCRWVAGPDEEDEYQECPYD